MAGPCLYLDLVPGAPAVQHRGGAPGLITKLLWKPSWHVVLGTPTALGTFETGDLMIPLEDARLHFRRQYDKLMRWVYVGMGEERMRLMGAPGAPTWHALRSACALFDSADYHAMLELLANGGGTALWASLSTDARSDEGAERRQLADELRGYTTGYNRVLDLLGHDDPEALLREPLITRMPDEAAGLLRWLAGSTSSERMVAFRHPLLTEEEVYDTTVPYLLGN